MFRRLELHERQIQNRDRQKASSGEAQNWKLRLLWRPPQLAASFISIRSRSAQRRLLTPRLAWLTCNAPWWSDTLTQPLFEPFFRPSVPIETGGLQFPVLTERHQALFGLGAFCVSGLFKSASGPKKRASARGRADHENRKTPISKPAANAQRPNVQAETTRTRIRRSCGISWDRSAIAAVSPSQQGLARPLWTGASLRPGDAFRLTSNPGSVYPASRRPTRRV